jgi:CheY-like chemotaxis protein/HPt (histidine-containing phosphotransfer) domain-containing protein
MTLEGRLLLAEDAPDNQRLFSFFLRRAGATVEIAGNGVVACQMALAAAAAGTPYDVILMDMQMPELDGYQATTRLRGAGYSHPIIALTAHAMASDRERCLRAGCTDFATKPIEFDALIAMIRRHLRAGEENGAAEPLVSTLATNDDVAPLLEMFVGGLAERVVAMEQSLSVGDLDALGVHAHQLKGTAGAYGFPPITKAAGALEAGIRSGADADDIRERLGVVADLCRRARSSERAPAA